MIVEMEGMGFLQFNSPMPGAIQHGKMVVDTFGVYNDVIRRAMKKLTVLWVLNMLMFGEFE